MSSEKRSHLEAGQDTSFKRNEDKGGPKEQKDVNLYDVIDRRMLDVIVEETGFTFAPNPGPISPGSAGWYTDITPGRKVIFYNPEDIKAELADRKNLEHLILHEGGHHAPPVVEFQDGAQKVIDNKALLQKYSPHLYEQVKDNQELATLVRNAAFSNAINATADLWLERYVGRTPRMYIKNLFENPSQEIREDFEKIEEMAKEKTKAALEENDPQMTKAVISNIEHNATLFRKPIPENISKELLDETISNWNDPQGEQRETKEAIVSYFRDQFKLMPKTAQFTQIIVGLSRALNFNKTEDVALAKEVFSEEVVNEFIRIKRDINTIGSADAFDAFATRKTKKQAVGRKVRAFEQSVYPVFLKFLEEEFGEMQQQYENQKAFEEALKGMLEEMIKNGDEQYGSKAQQGDEQRAAEAARRASQREGDDQDPGENTDPGEGREGGGGEEERDGGGEGDSEDESEDATSKKIEGTRNTAKKLARQERQSKLNQLAEQYGVTPSSMIEKEKIITTHEHTIRKVSDELADLLIMSRKDKLVQFLSEGYDVIDGLEAEYIAAIRSGNLEPKVMQDIKERHHFLSSEIMFLIDNSGSMHGEPLDASLEAAIIMARAFELAKQELDDEGLVDFDEESALKIGGIAFADEPIIVQDPQDPIDEKTLARIANIKHLQSGGTDDATALEVAYEKMLQSDNPLALKMIFMYTDGWGDREGVQKLVEKIEKDDELILVVCGLGSEAAAVVDVYEEARKQQGSNIIVRHFTNIGDMENLSKETVKIFMEKLEDMRYRIEEEG